MNNNKNPEHLIKMINQISANLGTTGERNDVAAEVAVHIKKFWTPAMICNITDYATADGKELSGISILAVEKLTDNS